MRRKSRTRTQVEEKARQQFLAAYIASKWPAFVFDVEDADPDFVEQVKKAVKAFRYEDLHPLYQDAFLILRQDGSDAADEYVHRAFEALRKDFPKDPAIVFGEIVWACEPGWQLLKLLPADLLPFHDAIIVHWKRNILVQCRSLTRVDTGRETLWHSRSKPTVTVNGKRYFVAFTRHTIDMILERINPRKDYMAVGDTCAYLHQTVHFETCVIRNRTTKQYDQLAVTFYAFCGEPPFTSWLFYVRNVLGEKNLNPLLGKPYYRIGYCPAFLDGDFIKLGSLLYPGYTATPEYRALMESSLSQHEKDRLIALATSDDGAENLLKTGDCSALKWFHENGVPQVIQTKKEIYKRAPRVPLVISDMMPK